MMTSRSQQHDDASAHNDTDCVPRVEQDRQHQNQPPNHQYCPSATSDCVKHHRGHHHHRHSSIDSTSSINILLSASSTELMTIIATTSPEIKALNLDPITPTFPKEINLFPPVQSHRREDGGVASSSSFSNFDALGMIEAEEDDERCYPSAYDASLGHWTHQQTKEVMDFLHKQRIDDRSDECSLHDQDKENREMLSPNVNNTRSHQHHYHDGVSPIRSISIRSNEYHHMNRRSNSDLEAFYRSTGSITESLSSSSSTTKTRKPAHRRISYDSLPSPTEIDEIVLGVTHSDYHDDRSPSSNGSMNSIGMSYSSSNTSIGGRLSGSGPLFFPVDFHV
jgi:hypothetical protein